MEYKMYINVGGSEPKEYIISEEDRDIIVNKPREDWYMFTVKALNISLPRRSIMLIEPLYPQSPPEQLQPVSRRGRRLHEAAAEE